MLSRDLNKLRVVTKNMQASPGRGAKRGARCAFFGSTHARRTACVGPRGRRARPRRLTPEVPLRHAEACAAGRCRESTLSGARERLPSAVRSWVFHTLVLKGAGTGRRAYILPHARASSRRGYDPDGSSGGPLTGGVRDICVQSNLQSGTRVWEEVFASILSGRVGRSATSLASVQCSVGIHRGPGRRCQTSGGRCAG
ncbi:hypothetical protein EVAR_61572_1 [Eumeta japonica]|uniref:Uncharacterized protein n=1 Tax=Eumeta variegata TaxID=151549 RepID=A0A4C1YQ33_EUMVA|nr:hypothetical protein EVAR_61572_1 [Eumeta japonica]